MASWTYARADRDWSGSVGVIATIGVHVGVLLLFVVSNSEQPYTPPAPIMARVISVAPVEQVQQKPLNVNPVFASPQLHVPVPEIALADNTPGPNAPVSVSTAASASAHAEPQQAVASVPIFDADYLNNPAPRYPVLSKRMREQGVVLVRVHVLPNGLPEVVELKRSSGSVRLDESALCAVREWKFVPAQSSGRAVAAWVVIPVSFSLAS